MREGGRRKKGPGLNALNDLIPRHGYKYQDYVYTILPTFTRNPAENIDIVR